ncbi:Polyketide cyclase / dehydrase and lipid transport [Synechococcus sp. PCC 7502]|nr:Polyketide cyclase / dehydrase and lipid transport [Synechococcus sp. PCC 7502]
MEINSKAPAISRHEIIINASSEIIWELLTDINHWCDWNPNISESRLEGVIKPSATFRWKSGGTLITSTLQQVDPQRRMSWTGRVVGTQAIHVWILEPHENAVLVRTEESFEGWLVSLSRGMMQRILDKSLVAWLEHLKRKAENAN